MSTKILICDDSRMARRQLIRSLPKDWDVEALQAEDGQQALEIIQSEQPALMFLDLNMPVLDGYQTLQTIKDQALLISVVVVSGDIQPAAQEKVSNLGALKFVKKPISANLLSETLTNLGFYKPAEAAPLIATQPDQPRGNEQISFNDEQPFLDVCQEVANVAMGRAGDLLARFLGVFVELPIPKVNHIELAELNMALQFADQDQTVSSVCQGFIGLGIAGEALVLFNDSSFSNIAKLLKYEGEINDSVQLELLMDVANIIVGACLQGISDQLILPLNQGSPLVLGQHVRVPDLIQQNVKRWNKTLSIEINYKIENHAINCDLLLLFTEESIEPIKQRLSYLIHDDE